MYLKYFVISQVNMLTIIAYAKMEFDIFCVFVKY